MQKDQKCIQFEAQLPAYLEGEASPGVLDHASRCPVCHTLLDDLNQIVAASRHLPFEDPPPQVWARIRASLAEERAPGEAPSGWQRWFRDFGLAVNPVPVAALVGLALLGAGVLLHTRIQNLQHISRERLIATTTRPELAPDTSDEANLGRTIKEMESVYRAGKSKLDPSLQSVYENSLATLDYSIAQCRSSVQEEPSNDLAHEYLLNAYAQKAELLTSALEVEGP